MKSLKDKIKLPDPQEICYNNDGTVTLIFDEIDGTSKSVITEEQYKNSNVYFDIGA